MQMIRIGLWTYSLIQAQLLPKREHLSLRGLAGQSKRPLREAASFGLGYVYKQGRRRRASTNTGMRTTLFSSSPTVITGLITVNGSRNYTSKFQRNSETSRWSQSNLKFHVKERTSVTVCSALPETAASIMVAAVAVGAAATLLSRTTKASETVNINLKPCEDCGGSGICTECKGEGFKLKTLSQESADRARLAAKNMATRYTAGLPKKWSYCSKCNSSRACITCRGSGQINI